MILIRRYISNSTHHLNKIFGTPNTRFIISNKYIKVLLFKRYTRRNSWRIYKNLVLLPRLLNIRYIILFLFFINISRVKHTLFFYLWKIETNFIVECLSNLRGVNGNYYFLIFFYIFV